MRKFKSLASLLFAGLLVVGCSSSKQDVEQLPSQDLYGRGQAYLQEGDYLSAIRYLEAVDGRFRNSGYGEQTLLSLMYANYKTAEYSKTLEYAYRFVRQYPDSPQADYVYYVVGLTNMRLSDNFIQDFFGVNRSSRAVESVRNAYGNFQTLVQRYPQSQYAADAQARMDYLYNRIAAHELEIAKFYDKREAYVAVINRVEEMTRYYPDTKATHDALPLMQKAFSELGLQDSADKAAALIEANKDTEFPDVSKPAYPEQF